MFIKMIYIPNKRKINKVMTSYLIKKATVH